MNNIIISQLFCITEVCSEKKYLGSTPECNESKSYILIILKRFNLFCFTYYLVQPCKYYFILKGLPLSRTFIETELN